MSVRQLTMEEALSVPREPHVWAGGLPREPRWPGGDSRLMVDAEDEAAAGRAAREWLRHVEAGRIGG